MHGQVDDLISEVRKTTANGGKILVTTLTKKMAEDLTAYMEEVGIRVRYLHSDIHTLERTEIIRDMRLDVFDVLVGINLLREGLDIPEIELVAILDADKEGFLRSDTAMVQTIGRAARNEHGHVVMYADRLTDSMKRAIDETNRRRELQETFNREHGITPKTVYKAQRHLIKLTKVEEDLDTKKAYDDKALKKSSAAVLRKLAKSLESKMAQAAKELDFETAAELRDRLIIVKGQLGEKLQPGKKRQKI